MHRSRASACTAIMHSHYSAILGLAESDQELQTTGSRASRCAPSADVPHSGIQPCEILISACQSIILLHGRCSSWHASHPSGLGWSEATWCRARLEVLDSHLTRGANSHQVAILSEPLRGTNS